MALVLLATGLAPARAGVVQLTTPALQGQFPQINNRGQVAWTGFDGTHWYIEFWDGTTVRQIAPVQIHDQSPQINDAGQIVWADPTGIFLWDGTTARQIRSAPTSANAQGPVINDAGEVAWTESNAVYFWNRVAVQQISQGSSQNGSLVINPRGEVVWNGYDGQKWQAYLWDGTSLRNLSNGLYGENLPALNDVGQVVWGGTDGTNWGLFLWDGSSVQEQTGPFASRPKINHAGQVAWVGGPVGFGQVYLRTGASIRQLTNYGADPVTLNESAPYPEINDAGQIVWQHWNGQSVAVYLWDGATIQQIGENARINGTPLINAVGQVVWQSQATSPGTGPGPSPVPSDLYLFTPAVAGSLDLSPTPVVGGRPVQGTITLKAPAPSGGTVVTLSSDNSAVASVPASITVPAGTTAASFPVTTTPVAAATSVTLSASYDGVTPTATLRVLPPALASVAVDLISAVGGVPATGTVTISDPAPTGGLMIALTSDNPAATVPATVTVPAGSSTATFPIRTHPVAAQADVTVSTTFNGVTQSASLQVLPPVLASVIFSASTVTAGDDAMVTVTLTGPAPAGGMAVSLSSPDAALPLPASVIVPGGSTTRQIEIGTEPVAAAVSVTIAAVAGGVTRTATVSLLPITLADLTLAPSPVLRGHRALGTIRLSGPARGVVVVTLSSANPAVARPAAQVMVPAGASAATFPVVTYRVRTATDVLLTAAAAGTTRTATLTVLPAGLTTFNLSSARVRGGASTTGRITLYGPAPAGGAVLTLSSSQPELVRVPATVTVPAGARSVTFSVTTTSPPGATAVVISTTYAGVTQTAVLQVLRR